MKFYTDIDNAIAEMKHHVGVKKLVVVKNSTCRWVTTTVEHARKIGYGYLKMREE